MSKFNKKSVAEKAKSFEGNEQYAKTPLEEWMNFLMSSYMSDAFYEDASTQMTRFIELTDEVGKKYGYEFVAKAAFFARNDLGMRSAAELVAATLDDKQFEGKRKFYENFPNRPDDVAEIFGAIKNVFGGKPSHGLVKGAGRYLSKLDDYKISKYKMLGKDYNIYDLVNITHATSPAITRLKADALKPVDTWENKISNAGSEEARHSEWRRLVEENKLGYLALIRNLRNILSSVVDNSWIAEYLVPQLTDYDKIHKSLVFPYQIFTAWKNLPVRNNRIDTALSIAFERAVDNVPDIDGRTLVILDVSGSMDNRISENSSVTIKEAGAVYAAVLALKTYADVVKFGNDAKFFDFNPVEDIFYIIQKMCNNDNLGYGTDIRAAYGILKKKYDRIFIISDMQTMKNTPSWYSWEPDGNKSLSEYRKKTGANPHVYSYDLGNYHSQIENPNNPKIHLLTAFKDDIFKLIPLLENGGNLAKYIDENYSYM